MLFVKEHIAMKMKKKAKPIYDVNANEEEGGEEGEEEEEEEAAEEEKAQGK